MWSLCELVEGVIVVAVTIDIVGVKLVDIVLEVYDKVSTTSGLRVKQTRRIPITSNFRVYKGSIG